MGWQAASKKKSEANTVSRLYMTVSKGDISLSSE